MFEKGDEITLDNGSKYIVSDSFELNNKNYLHLISLKNKNNLIIVENNNGILNEIEDENEYKSVFNELVIRNKDEIEKYLEGINEN